MPYSREQRQNIDLALRLSRGYGPRVRQALLEAMAVEASYRNLPYGDRDSEGVLQQRPSQGWGPASESAATDIRQFLQRAGALAQRGFQGSAGQLAQAVQHSAFPGRYDEHAGETASLLGGGGSGNVAGPILTRDAPVAGSTPADPRKAVLSALISASQERNPDYEGVIAALGQVGAARAAPAPSPAGPPSSTPAGGGASGDLLAQLRRFHVADSITSGERSVAENRATGGSPTSYHLPGGPDAYDLDPADPDIPGLVRFARSNPGYFKEFYGPMNWRIENGKILRGRQPGHSDHYHAAR